MRAKNRRKRIRYGGDGGGDPVRGVEGSMPRARLACVCVRVGVQFGGVLPKALMSEILPYA